MRVTDYPALRAWREELARGERTAQLFDPLFRAACCEAWAVEFASTLPQLAAHFRHEARRIVAQAARETKTA